MSVTVPGSIAIYLIILAITLSAISETNKAHIVRYMLVTSTNTSNFGSFLEAGKNRL